MGSLKPQLVLAEQSAMTGGYFDRRTLGLTRTVTRKSKGAETSVGSVSVLILRGLPQSLFRAVAAHECCHAWARLRGIRQSKVEEEGLAEVISHRYLTRLGGPDHKVLAKGIEESRLPVYGTGFRSVNAAVQHVGLKRYLATLKSSAR